MRWPYLVLLVAGAAVADEPPYSRRFAVSEPELITPAPGLPALSHANKLWLMIVGEDATPSCEAWDVIPDPAAGSDAPRDGKLVSGVDEVYYHSSGDRLTVCDNATTARADGAELDVGGARWFHDEASCKRAIGKHRAVGMDFTGCTPSRAAADELGATQGKLEAIIRHGGSLFTRTGNRCDRIQLVADAREPDTGTWVVGDGTEAEERSTYHYGPTHLENGLGMELVFTGVDGMCVCVDDKPLDFRAGFVRMAGAPLYLDRASCNGSVALDAKRAAWLPAVR